MQEIFLSDLSLLSQRVWLIAERKLTSFYVQNCRCNFFKFLPSHSQRFFLSLLLKFPLRAECIICFILEGAKRSWNIFPTQPLFRDSAMSVLNITSLWRWLQKTYSMASTRINFPIFIWRKIDYNNRRYLLRKLSG